MLTELPLNVVLPVLNIFKSPFEPLMKLFVLPKLNAEELMLTLVPSKFIPSPVDLPICALVPLPKSFLNLPYF